MYTIPTTNAMRIMWISEDAAQGAAKIHCVLRLRSAESRFGTAEGLFQKQGVYPAFCIAARNRTYQFSLPPVFGRGTEPMQIVS